MGDHHLTQAFLELQLRDTKMLSTVKPPLSEIPNLFTVNSVSLFSEQNSELRDHMRHVTGISVGRRLAAENSSAKVLGTFLPAHHIHSRSHHPKEKAILVIKPPEYL